ncbi:hypothetical protein SLEP1_g45497 [Rubroshorea leprosula]|uniref:Uncharacterized protein n=1 Tax=Rubroshorea leprosula TaxID=152421 RepID=A0AAV5LJC0_9ROSI|nr:hypothetical protein SLEP1_g45497 [Rubroshorea leprosula]
MIPTIPSALGFGIPQNYEFRIGIRPPLGEEEEEGSKLITSLRNPSKEVVELLGRLQKKRRNARLVFWWHGDQRRATQGGIVSVVRMELVRSFTRLRRGRNECVWVRYRVCSEVC